MEENHQDCSYCAEGKLLAAFGVKICELPMSKVILFKEQSHKGRVIVACKRHVDDLTDLTAQERAQFTEDLNRVAEVVHEIFQPDKVNFGAYGDTMHHMHVHVVPKYRDGYEWGGVFAMNPHENEPSEAELDRLVEQIRAKLV
ncbi:MAG: HIT family protein [Lachnospiraceae bacterium]|nr:HIT family protein [Lachnospiraceae bacterium]